MNVIQDGRDVEGLSTHLNIGTLTGEDELVKLVGKVDSMDEKVVIVESNTGVSLAISDKVEV